MTSEHEKILREMKFEKQNDGSFLCQYIHTHIVRGNITNHYGQLIIYSRDNWMIISADGPDVYNLIRYHILALREKGVLK